jgi:hypothetical protein
MQSALDGLWAQIVEVHNEAKTLFLLGEELDRDQFRDFIQPINEHRHSLEHIVRAQANSLGLDPDGKKDEQYQCDSLRKALGHEYRAFFDCADWIGIILREDIEETLRPYGASSIHAVLPEYYPDLRPRIQEISESIAQKRGDKNVSKDGQITDDVRGYKAILDELRDIHRQITRVQGALEDHQSRTRREGGRKWMLSVLGALVAGGIIALAGVVLGRRTEATPPSRTLPPEQEAPADSASAPPQG